MTFFCFQHNCSCHLWYSLILTETWQSHRMSVPCPCRPCSTSTITPMKGSRMVPHLHPQHKSETITTCLTCLIEVSLFCTICNWFWIVIHQIGSWIIRHSIKLHVCNISLNMQLLDSEWRNLSYEKCKFRMQLILSRCN